MKKIVLSILSLLFLSITIILIITFIKRLDMRFNEEGKYFDEDSLVVYEEQSKEIFGILSIIFSIITYFIINKTINIFRK